MTSPADSWTGLGPDGQQAVRAVLGKTFSDEEARTFAEAGIAVQPTTNRSGGMPTFILPAAFEEYVNGLPAADAD